MSANAPETADLRFVPVRAAADVRQVAALANEIWHEYYVPLIGAEQVEYMVAKFQSAAVMQEQIERGDEYFSITRAGQLLGYIAVRANLAERALFISKLYLQRGERGAGSGRRALQFIEQLARQRNLELLWLTVNKRNPAVQAYQKWGFAIAESLCIDIGAGFVMDDYRMEKRLPGDHGIA